MLSVDQKQQRVDDSEGCLQLFLRNKKEFLRKYMTMEETWIQHFTSESNRQSAEWTAAGESRPKWPKTQTSAGKVLASVFWDVRGILFIDYLEKGRAINSEYYIILLVLLKEEIAKNGHKRRKKCPFTETMHHIISRWQRWQNYMNCTWNCFRSHPILQIWPPATVLFADLKRMLLGKRSGSNEKVISEAEAYFEVKDKSFCKKKKSLELLEKRWNQCITLEGDYVDE